MKKLFWAVAISTVLLVSGCANFASTVASTVGDTPSQSTKTTIVEVFADACNTYATSLRSAAAAHKLGLLSPANVAAVDKAQSVADPLCKGPQPTNIASAVVDVLTASSNIVLNSGGH